MMLGLSLPAFLALHVAISFAGIGTGFVALIALARGRYLRGWNIAFLATTLATSLTGFLFPFAGFTPAIGVGVISTVDLAIAMFALAGIGHKRGAAVIYAVTATIGLYLNLFVLIVQSFLKVPSLHALAPNGNEPPFAVAQLVLLVAIIGLGYHLVRNREKAA
jgi:hypothetical protein